MPRVFCLRKRAEEALRAFGVWEEIEPKLVDGESIALARRFADYMGSKPGHTVMTHYGLCCPPMPPASKINTCF